MTSELNEGLVGSGVERKSRNAARKRLMLVLDAFKGHLTREMKATITSVSIKHALPSHLQGIASKLQSLCVVNKPFTDRTNSYTWCGYKINGLNFFSLPCKPGNSERYVVLACALPSIHGYNFNVMWQTVWQ